ncbi:hypothetical protein [Deinococcus rufus]|uniref:Uncharacterized protein n=1 Tax=Deinococcus rufus TaxID=2136097 RepID=A0ABV7Z9S8_9DEIO
MADHPFTALTPTQAAVLQDVRYFGAVTARRLERDHAPRAEWDVLIRTRWLASHDSVHGELMALGPYARAQYAAQNVFAPYLAGPAAVVDRAYQNDALARLAADGYTMVAPVYKAATGITRATSRRRVTSQVLRHIMRAPNVQDLQLFSRTPPDERERVRGHPLLYATVSGGGISEQRLRRLLTVHDNDIQTYWRSPLLIAVPDLSAVRRVVREANAQQERAVDTHERTNPGQVGRLLRTLVQVIQVPHPDSPEGRYGDDGHSRAASDSRMQRE